MRFLFSPLQNLYLIGIKNLEPVSSADRRCCFNPGPKNTWLPGVFFGCCCSDNEMDPSCRNLERVSTLSFPTPPKIPPPGLPPRGRAAKAGKKVLPRPTSPWKEVGPSESRPGWPRKGLKARVQKGGGLMLALPSARQVQEAKTPLKKLASSGIPGKWFPFNKYSPQGILRQAAIIQRKETWEGDGEGGREGAPSVLGGFRPFHKSY